MNDQDPSFPKSSAEDHDEVARMVRYRLKVDSQVGEIIEKLFRNEQLNKSNLIIAIRVLGDYVEPVDPAIGVDEERLSCHSFFVGSIVAMEVLDTIAREKGIEKSEFRSKWNENAQDMINDLIKVVEEHPEERRRDATADMIVESGLRQFGCVEQPYVDLVETIGDTGVVSHAHTNVYKAAFGYFYRYGSAVLGGIVADDLLKGGHDWDLWASGLSRD